MEENITQRKTVTISIALYSSAPFSTGIQDRITAFINPDGKDVRQFALTQHNVATAKILEGIHLAMAIGSDDDPGLKKLLEALSGEKIPAVRIGSCNDEESLKAVIAELEKALDLGFTVADFAYIHNYGIPLEKIRRQLAIFKNGIPKATLKKSARMNDGIVPLGTDSALAYAAYFDDKKNNFRLTKFIPASGAATRMFKFLHEFIAEFNPEEETINSYINRNKKRGNPLSIFLVGLDKFPFYNDIQHALEQHPDYSLWNRDMKRYQFIKAMIEPRAFDFSCKPKGILPFHKYGNVISTPVYEHLRESVAYAESGGEANVHFTISEDHLDGFLDAIKDVREDIEKETGVKINFSFSYQHRHTDTLSVTTDNTPFRDTDGSLLFRPGGHGALIDNLGQLDADIVFIKNIDNVSHNNIQTIALYKKALAGMLVKLQEHLFLCLGKLDNHSITGRDIDDILAFAKDKLCLHVPFDVSKYTLENKREFARQLLDRPVRICGMVKNEGEPGGGPFWVQDGRGNLSLQIVESSQIDLDNKAQQDIFATATHFNPVDLVCGLKNYKGEFFDLSQYVDESSGFIVYKNKSGRDLKGYELPGLWNGAMAGWITIFAEVPLETFNPVKTVNDLLKPAHQPQ